MLLLGHLLNHLIQCHPFPLGIQQERLFLCRCFLTSKENDGHQVTLAFSFLFVCQLFVVFPLLITCCCRSYLAFKQAIFDNVCSLKNVYVMSRSHVVAVIKPGIKHFFSFVVWISLLISRFCKVYICLS